MSITLSALQKQRRDTAANWTAENPTLLAGEIGLESDTGYWKVGNGVTAWNSLAYISGLGAEIPVNRLADGSARQLLQTAANGTDVEWTSNVDVPGTLDVTGIATFDSNIVVQGNLTVNGTTTTIDTQNLIVEDKNIVIGQVTTPTDVTADGGGITLKGATDKTINWVDATDAWTFSEHVNIASAKEYRIAGTKVLDATSLGSGVVSSSLTSVGTIATGTWQGTTIATGYGGTGETTYTDGQLLIGKTDGTLAKSTLTAGSNVTITNGNGTISIASTDTTYTAGDGLDLVGSTFSADLKANGGLVIESTELAVDLGATSITGTLATGDGGTGQTTYSNGQLLIGKSDGTLAKATLTASTGVTITNGDGAITISSVGLGGTVTDVTATSPIASTGGTAPDISIQDASTSQKGAVQLEDSTSSTSTTKAATPNSVKSAYDLANAALPKAGGTLTGDVTLNAQSDLRFADADSSNWVALQAPATVASNVTWSLPNADGTANQVLKTDGAGALGWAAAGGATLNEFTSSGTWTKPSGANFVMVEVWGAGGGGGSGRTGANSTVRNGGGGGGGGAYNYKMFKASDLAATVSITIGAGGAGGAAINAPTGNTGTDGGSTTFGTLLTVYGGNGGPGGGTTTAGGTGGGTISTSGLPSDVGFGGGNSNVSGGGTTGSSGFGGGAGGGNSNVAVSTPGFGSSSGGCGGGGGGGANASNVSTAGSDGGSQFVPTDGGGAGGASTGAAGANGGAFQGGGGAGGNGNFAGGDGGIASGGGGGSGRTSTGTAGRGGDGGPGYCRVYTW